jgi:hypothetical protein
MDVTRRPLLYDWHKGLNSKFKADEASVYRSINIDYVKHDESRYEVKFKYK